MSDYRILFNGIDERVALDRDEGDVAYFNALMLKLEYVYKGCRIRCRGLHWR